MIFDNAWNERFTMPLRKRYQFNLALALNLLDLLLDAGVMVGCLDHHREMHNEDEEGVEH